MAVEETEVALLPAFGFRPDRNDDLRPEALARVLAERTLAGRHRPVVLLGHSASCQIVVHAAVARPDAVSALVLVGPTTDPRAQSWPALAQRWLRTAAHEDPRQVPMLVRLYRRNGVRQMLRAMDAARGDDIRQSLDYVTCPVLVLRGRRDRICPEDWAHALARMGPQGWRGESLKAGAHMVPITHGSDTAAAINRFLLGSAASGPGP
jgi:pimeloyl-ACP methyl ester carboxylesterase